jgi:hypothetical protein
MGVVAMPLSRLIYYSEKIPTMSAHELSEAVDEILRVSRKNNARDQVTGALIEGDHHFLQVLEGRRPHVSDAFLRIAKDDRHKSIRFVDFSEIQSRQFEKWNMYCVSDNTLLQKAISEQVNAENGCETIFKSENLPELIQFVVAYDESHSLKFDSSAA